MILFGNQQNRATYKPVTVTIGTQVWALANFSESTLINGTVIPEVTDPTAWAALTTAAWCNYNNDSAIGAEYGKLYNWWACALIDAAYNPYGWRVATQADWDTLITGQGGASVAGQKLKEAGTIHWAIGNTGNNSSGFTWFGNGYRGSGGVFSYLNERATIYSSTESGIYGISFRTRYNINSVETITSLTKQNGNSIRLIKI